MKKALLSAATIMVLGFLNFYFFMPGALFAIFQKIERKTGGLEEKSIMVNGLNIHYLEGGKGDSLVLIHGFGGNKDHWTRISRFLTPYFNVIAPDLPGFGESDEEPDGKYSIKDQAHFLKQFVEQLGIKSFHIGGNSMGGYITGQYAALFPGDLKSLFLISPAGVLSSEFSQMQQRIKNGGPNPLIAKDAGEFDELLEFIFVKKPFIPGPIKNYLKDEAIRHQALNETIFQRIKDTDLNEPMESLLGHLNVNAFILWGSDDKVLHPSGARILEAIIKNSKAQVMKNVGHAPMIELPKKTAGLYLEFHNMK